MLLGRPTLSRIINTSDKIKPSYFFYSKKMNRLIFCESRLENCGNKILDMDEVTASFNSQPFSFNYFFKEKYPKYTPDISMVTYSKLNLLGEYKPLAKLSPFINKNGVLVNPNDKYDAIRTYVIESGFDEFLMLTDDLVYQEPRLFNTELLHFHANARAPDKKSVSIIEEYLRDGPKIVDQTLKHLDKMGIDRNVVWYLIGNKRISIDITEIIDLETELSWRLDNDL